MEAAVGKRSTFTVLATTTPKLLVGEGTRQGVLIYNNTSANIYVGSSGTVGGGNGLVIPTNTQFWDLLSLDSWWVATPSSSGTVSGMIVF